MSVEIETTESGTSVSWTNVSIKPDFYRVNSEAELTESEVTIGAVRVIGASITAERVTAPADGQDP